MRYVHCVASHCLFWQYVSAEQSVDGHISALRPEYDVLCLGPPCKSIPEHWSYTTCIKVQATIIMCAN